MYSYLLSTKYAQSTVTTELL